MAERKAVRKAARTANPAAKKPARKSAKPADDEAMVRAKIAAMRAPFRAMGERLHALILNSAPALRPKLFYGMPGYAERGPVLCFFRTDKYMTFGLTDRATFAREEGAPHQLMASAWYFDALDDATEAALSVIVRKAVG